MLESGLPTCVCKNGKANYPDCSDSAVCPTCPPDQECAVHGKTGPFHSC